MKIIFIFILINIHSYSFTQTSAGSSRIISNENGNLFKKLSIGEKLPQNIYASILNYSSEIINLSTLNGKYIILDFWNKYCGTCISSFPKTKMLADKFKDRLLIVTVTTDSKLELENLKKRSPIIQDLKLPIIYNDSLLSHTLFPSNGVPYYVWVDSSFTIKAFTGLSEVNELNIASFISGKSLNVIQRLDDVSESVYRELTNENSKEDLINMFGKRYVKHLKYYKSYPHSPENYSLFLESSTSGSLKDIVLPANVVYLRDSLRNIQGIRIFNNNILELYKTAYKLNDERVKKIVLDKNVGFEREPNLEDTESWVKWNIRNSYCYESRYNGKVELDPSQILQQDLVTYFGVIGKIEVREIDCLVLQSNENREKTNSLTAESNASNIIENTLSDKGIIIDTQFRSFVSYLQIYFNLETDPLVVDESKIRGNKRICTTIYSKSIKDIVALRASLKEVGIDIKFEKRLIKVLTLKNVQ